MSFQPYPIAIPYISTSDSIGDVSLFASVTGALQTLQFTDLSQRDPCCTGSRVHSRGYKWPLRRLLPATTLSHFLPYMKLPAPTGKYPVGYASFTTPVSHPFVIGGATLDNGRPALELKELAFGVFYPAVKEHRWHKGVAWLPRCVVTLARLDGWAC